MRVEGRLLQVIDEQRLDNIELDLPAAENAPANCNKVCLRSYVGNVSKQLSQDVSVILTKNNAIAFSSGSNDFDNTSDLTSATPSYLMASTLAILTRSRYIVAFMVIKVTDRTAHLCVITNTPIKRPQKVLA